MSSPSAAATRPTSSTVSCMACCMAMAACRELPRAILSREAGNSAEHHPPLRPLAPNPATFASTIAMRVPGAAFAR